MAVLARGAEEMIPALGRVAEPEGARGFAGDPAAVEVGAGTLRLRPLPEPRLEAARRPLEEGEKSVPRACFSCVLVSRQGNASALGEEAHRLGELQAIVPAQELERVATRATAEAVEEVEFRVNGEGGRLFLVERAEPLPPLAGALERHDCPHEVHEIHAGPDLVQDLGGHFHRLALRPETARGPRCCGSPSDAFDSSRVTTVAPAPPAAGSARRKRSTSGCPRRHPSTARRSAPVPLPW